MGPNVVKVSQTAPSIDSKAQLVFRSFSLHFINFSFSLSTEKREMLSLALYWSMRQQRAQKLFGSCSSGFSFHRACNLEFSSQLSLYDKHALRAVFNAVQRL